MSETGVTKTEAFAKSKKAKRIFIILLVVILLAGAVYITIVVIKKVKQKKLLNAEQNKATGSTSSAASSSMALPAADQNVKAIQSAINKSHPDAALQVDGVMGPVTKAAIIKYYGVSAYPLTSDSMALILSGVGPSTPVGSSQADNDDFPLKMGSYGNLVVALKQMVNGLYPQANLDISDNRFDQALYNGLITGVGTKYYPVSSDNFFAINNQYNAKKDPMFNPAG